MNDIDICNQALSQLGVNNIQALTEATKEARQCKLFYPSSRDAVLEAHDWDFARKRLVLALSSQTVSDWNYVYQYPSDCLKARKLLDTSDASTPLEYEVAIVGGSKMILTNEADAELIYTSKITDANLFSPSFINVLGLLIAANLAIPLKGKPDLQKSFMQLYFSQVASSKSLDANQSNKKPNDKSDFAKARD